MTKTLLQKLSEAKKTKPKKNAKKKEEEEKDSRKLSEGV
tara:strand:- start:356 stop:472 length:117 start_codon:yes stop_codon:yes gene_type:complete